MTSGRDMAIGKLSRWVFASLALVAASILFFFTLVLSLQINQNTLNTYLAERQSLERLYMLVIDTSEGVLSMVAFQKEDGILQLLSKSEDFQFAFDSYYDATIDRKGLTELSLAREIEPVITMLRSAIVKTVSLHKKGQPEVAKLFYLERFSRRVEQVKRFTSDGIYSLDILIAEKEAELTAIKKAAFLISIAFIVCISGVAALVVVFSRQAINQVQINLADLASTNRELIEREQEIIRFQGQLVESAKMASLGKMSSGIAHELNQPLSAAIFKAEIIPRLISKDRIDEVSPVADGIVDQLMVAKQIMDSLRVFSRQDKRVDRDYHNVNQIVKDVILLFADEFNLSEVRLELDLTVRYARAYVSQVQLGQVLANMIGNARDVIEDNDLKQITIRTSVENDNVIVEISDNGSGMSDSVLSHIFEPFFTTKPVGKGTGLGLSLSHSMIKDNDGNITVNTEEGVGTTFRIELPRLEKSSAGQNSPQPA